VTCISLNLRHIHDLVLLSIKVKVIGFFFFGGGGDLCIPVVEYGTLRSGRKLPSFERNLLPSL